MVKGVESAFASPLPTRRSLCTKSISDARWGDDDQINECRNRQQVVETRSRVLDEGADSGIDNLRGKDHKRNGRLRARTDLPIGARSRAPDRALRASNRRRQEGFR
jgi:hypothetical protein